MARKRLSFEIKPTPIKGEGTSVNIPEGEKGDPGLSAYELAVLRGYVGTESDWLDSLNGLGLTQEQVDIINASVTTDEAVEIINENKSPLTSQFTATPDEDFPYDRSKDTIGIKSTSNSLSGGTRLVEESEIYSIKQDILNINNLLTTLIDDYIVAPDPIVTTNNTTKQITIDTNDIPLSQLQIVINGGGEIDFLDTPGGIATGDSDSFDGILEVGNVYRPAGYYRFRIKSATGRAASNWVDSGEITFDVVYDTATQAYLAEVANIGGTVDDTFREYVDNIIKYLKSSGAWAIGSDFALFRGPSELVCSVHLKNPTGPKCIFNSGTFTPYQDWKGNGVDSYINFNFNPATANDGIYLQNSASRYLFQTVDDTLNTRLDGVLTDTRNRMRSENGSNNTINQSSGTSGSSFNMTGSNRWKFIWRESSSVIGMANATTKTTRTGITSSAIYNETQKIGVSGTVYGGCGYAFYAMGGNCKDFVDLINNIPI